MLAIVHTVALSGLDGHIVRVEVDASGGLPGWQISGLPDAAVREAKDRVRAAIKNAGFEFPSRRITVNLAPADIRKEGPGYDLAIAVGVMAATGQVAGDQAGGFLLFGELSLDGSLRSVSGILPAMAEAVGREFNRAIVPLDNATEAALVDGTQVFPVTSLRQVVAFLNGEVAIPPHTADVRALLDEQDETALDLADIKGQTVARRALELAAAGGHNLLMVGSPGAGKTMLARRLPGILPSLTPDEALECTKIYSLAGRLPPGRHLITRRPFRAPHHTASAVSLAGGGRVPRPGEISLAHHGVLFLDELPEFPRDALEALRQPLEDGNITIARASSAISFPAQIMLVGAMNPCPCGFFGDSVKECLCTPLQIQRYRGRISGPLLDRIDIQVEVGRVPFDELSSSPPGENSATVKTRVERARAIQRSRFAGSSAGCCNARMRVREIRRHCRLDREAQDVLRLAFRQLQLSARAHDRILKVARTIADLAGSTDIQASHVAEAVQYRTLDRKYWG